VIVEAAHARAPAIKKNKFLSPNDMAVGAFVAELKRHLVRGEGENDKSTEAIFLFTANNAMPVASQTMQTLYEAHKNPDGFLYLFYASENVFGSIAKQV
jgi:GABA(A) receptor-associated protein